MVVRKVGEPKEATVFIKKEKDDIHFFIFEVSSFSTQRS